MLSRRFIVCDKFQITKRSLFFRRSSRPNLLFSTTSDSSLGGVNRMPRKGFFSLRRDNFPPVSRYDPNLFFRADLACCLFSAEILLHLKYSGQSPTGGPDFLNLAMPLIPSLIKFFPPSFGFFRSIFSSQCSAPEGDSLWWKLP